MYLSKKQTKFIEQARHRLITAQGSNCEEDSHRDADNILCELLNQLGFYSVVEEYEKIDKYYSINL